MSLTLVATLGLGDAKPVLHPARQKRLLRREGGQSGLGDSAAQVGTAAALESAKGLLRSTVGKALGLRHSPSLAFVLDDVQEHVKEIDDLLAEAKQRDEAVQQLAAKASYAGDAQPYKLDDEAHEDDEEQASSAPSRR